MCGFLFEANAVSIVDDHRFNTAFDLINHRGPDGSVIVKSVENSCADGQSVQSSNVYIGHKRLSIIDIAGGLQPMSDITGQYTIAFNGEIFNFQSLRDILKEKYSIEFKTKSDTEVLLYGLIYEGIEFLHKCNGMWSFVLFNHYTKKIVFARDRYGIKPLYYFFDSLQVVFSSEIKPLLKYTSARINDSVLDFFKKTGIADFSDATFFKGINQVCAGESGSCIIEGQKISINFNQWYSIAHESRHDLSIDSCKQNYNELIDQSIRLRLESDVEVGALLSGGIDSSIIVSRAAVLSGKPAFRTFSGISNNKAFSEAPWVNAMLREYPNLNNTIVKMEQDVSMHEIDEVIHAQESPFSTSSVISQNRLFKAIKPSGLKVILDGQGSDEINLGYDKYFSYAIGQLVSQFHLQSARKYLSDIFSYKSPLHAFIFILNTVSPEFVSDIFRKIFGFSQSQDIKTYLNLSREMSLFEFENLIITKMMLPNHLKYLDKNSMQYSIEARSPFLDHKLVEFSLSLSAFQRLQNGRRKGLLLESMKDALPKEIYQRKNKIGFKSDDQQILKDISQENLTFRQYTINRWEQIFFKV
jgi:asparagine synthase (glutamine-hydrolysing)